MFDIKKFGGYLCCLRKNADMTQMELADKLNLTRQAVPRYEHGDSFPDVQGRIVEEGTHRELMQNEKNIYARMYQLQRGWYA